LKFTLHNTALTLNCGQVIKIQAFYYKECNLHSQETYLFTCEILPKLGCVV